MRKLFFLPLLLLIAACGAASGPEVTPVPESVDSEETAPQSTVPASSSSTTVLTGSTPEEASIIREQDHVKGASDPLVTIIEYGDFQ